MMIKINEIFFYWMNYQPETEDMQQTCVAAEFGHDDLSDTLQQDYRVNLRFSVCFVSSHPHTAFPLLSYRPPSSEEPLS